MVITVLNNQTFQDIAIQYTGNLNNFIFIAQANNVSGTFTPTSGMELTIPEDLEIDTDIVNYYNNNNIQPATSAANIESENFVGIDEMVIGSTFKIR